MFLCREFWIYTKKVDKWVGDFTYIRVANRFYYVCAIINLFGRKAIAYRVSSKIDRFLVIATLDAAIAKMGISAGVMFTVIGVYNSLRLISAKKLTNLTWFNPF